VSCDRLAIACPRQGACQPKKGWHIFTKGRATVLHWLIIEIIIWIIFGGVIGWAAAQLTAAQNSPLWLDVVIGIAGAFLGGLAVKLSTGQWYGFGLNLTSIMLALAGAIVLIVIYRLIRFWLA
jgi:uncharacterized membrane protein YeaQ/YmgE (transglycosylase-associated protein family)